MTSPYGVAVNDQALTREAWLRQRDEPPVPTPAISASQRRLLSTLSAMNDGWEYPSCLALYAAAGVHSDGKGAMVDTMISRGWVTRRRGGLHVTPAGRAVLGTP